MRIRSAIACLWLGAASSIAAGAANAGAPASLPPVELVQELRRARIEDLSGRTQAALEILHEVSRRWPGSLTAAMALWDFHRQHDLPDREVERHRAALIERLADPERALPSGALRFLVTNPDLDDAGLRNLLDATTSRLAANPEDPNLLRATLRLQRRLELRAEARDTCDRLLALRPDDAAVLDEALRLDLELERWESARRLFEPMVTDATPAVLRMAYIEVLARLGRFEALEREIDRLAGSALERGVSAPEQLAGFLLRIAWDLRDAGQDVGARKVFARVLEVAPDNAGARKALVYLYGTREERTRYEAEAGDRRHAGNDPQALAAEGAGLLAAGRVEEALGLLERASARLPDEELVWFNLGLAALKLSRWERAESAFAEAVRSNPGRAESWLHRGAALESLGRCDEAEPMLARALDLAPELGQACYYLYRCAKARGDEEAALVWLERYNAFNR